MAKSIEGAVYNPSQKWRPIEEGTYPAHIKSLSTKEVQTKAGEAIVVNMTYRVADEVSKETQPVWKMDGYKYVKDTAGNRVPVTNGSGVQEVASCDHLKGREFKDGGFFIFTESSSSSKNRRYFELLDKLGVKCEETSVDGDKVKKLVLIEEEDVVGKPVLITIKRNEFITSETKHLPHDQQERRSFLRVSTIDDWEEGVVLETEELDSDVPF